MFTKTSQISGLILLAITVALTGCGGGSDSSPKPIVSMEYLEGGLQLSPDATGMTAIAKDVPTIVRPAEMQTMGGDGHNLLAQVRNAHDQVVAPFEKETWTLNAIQQHSARVTDNGKTLPGIQYFRVVEPFTDADGMYLSIGTGQREFARHQHGFVLVEPFQPLLVTAKQRSKAAPEVVVPLMTVVSVYDLNDQLVFSGSRWTPRPGFFRLVGQSGQTRLTQWVYSVYVRR